MDNSSRYYQLALSFQNYARARNTSLKPSLAPLPYHIREEQDSQGNIDPKLENIFVGSSENRARRSEPELSVPYRCVGIKQMKAYISKTQKKKRQMNGMGKRSTEVALTALSLSRLSQTKVPQEKYLSRDEVLTNCAKQRAKKKDGLMEETYMSNDHSSIQQTMSHNTTMMGTTFGGQSTPSHKKSFSHDFSLRKVLARMKKYQFVWQKQMQMKDLNKHGLHKRSVTNKKTLLQQTGEFRNKIEEQQQNLVNEQLQNIQPKLWNRALRTSKTMVNLCQKNLLHVVKSGLVSAGCSKYEKEVEWIDQKDRQGHFFRLYKGSAQKEVNRF